MHFYLLTNEVQEASPKLQQIGAEEDVEEEKLGDDEEKKEAVE